MAPSTKKKPNKKSDMTDEDLYMNQIIAESSAKNASSSNNSAATAVAIAIAVLAVVMVGYSAKEMLPSGNASISNAKNVCDCSTGAIASLCLNLNASASREKGKESIAFPENQLWHLPQTFKSPPKIGIFMLYRFLSPSKSQPYF